MLYHKTCNYADMWPNQRWTLGEGTQMSPPHQGSNDDMGKEEFWILAAPLLTTGSIAQAPCDSIDDSIDFLELLTKPKKS